MTLIIVRARVCMSTREPVHEHRCESEWMWSVFGAFLPPPPMYFSLKRKKILKKFCKYENIAYICPQIFV